MKKGRSSTSCRQPKKGKEGTSPIFPNNAGGLLLRRRKSFLIHMRAYRFENITERVLGTALMPPTLPDNQGKREGASAMRRAEAEEGLGRKCLIRDRTAPPKGEERAKKSRRRTKKESLHPSIVESERVRRKPEKGKKKNAGLRCPERGRNGPIPA